MQKKLTLIFFGILFLLADFFGSFLFIGGKTPASVLGLERPKITITPFPTLVMENFNTEKSSFESVDSENTKSNTSTISANFIFFNASFPYQNLSLNQTFSLSCSYNSDNQFNADADLFFLAQSDLSRVQNYKNQAFLIKSMKNLFWQKGMNQMKVTSQIADYLPEGTYKGVLNVYSQDTHQVLSNCVSDSFNFTNNKPFVLTGLETSANNIPQLPQNKSLNFNLHSFGNFSKLKARVIIEDAVLKDGKVYYVKDLPEVSLKNNDDKNLAVDLSDFPYTGTYFINLELQDQNGNKLSLSPLQGFYAGDMIKIKQVSTSTGQSGYNVNIIYDNQVLKADNGLEMYATVCNASNCDFTNWIDLGKGWPDTLFIANKSWSADKNKIYVKVRLKDTFGYLINYHN